MAALDGPVTAQEIFREFKLNSLVLRKDALVAIQRTLRGANPSVSQHVVLRGLIDDVQTHIERGGGASSIVDAACISAVVAEKTKNETDVKDESFQVFSAFKMPHYSYDHARKAFELSRAPRSLHSTADAKISMYRERLVLATQRLSRHPAFVSASAGPAVPGTASKGRGHIKTVAIESLRGHHGKSVVVVGMLSCPEEGRYELEDLHSSVSLLFHPDCSVPVGLLTETCIVIVEGTFDQDGAGGQGALTAEVVGQPPVEDRVEACAAMGVVDPSRALSTPAEFAQAFALEQAASRAFIVTASDVHLDDPGVFKSLRLMLDTWTSFGATPTAFVLMGPFLSHPFGAGPTDKEDLTRGLDDLGALIADFPALSAAPWILVPSPHDPGAARILPRPGLPPSFCRRLKQRAPQVVLATNPCRLRFFTQEIVVFREDVSARLGKHAVKTSLAQTFEFDDVAGTQPPAAGAKVAPPKAAEDGDGDVDLSGAASAAKSGGDGPSEGGGSEVTKAALQTMLHQMHLLPLPLRVQPAFWEFDYALRLYPPPQVMAIGESCSEYHYAVEGTTCFNPGSFAHGGKFAVYYPATYGLEMSQV